MGLNGYNPQIITISTRCSAQSTRLSYLVHLAQRGERRPITFSNSGCRRTNSPAGRHFGGARGGMNSRDPWNKDGIHKRVFPPSLMTSAYRWGTECSDVLRQRTTEESVVGTERGRTVPSAICANISAIVHMFVVARVGMSAGEGGSDRMNHNLTLITPLLVLSASPRSEHSISMLEGTRLNARNGIFFFPPCRLGLMHNFSYATIKHRRNLATHVASCKY